MANRRAALLELATELEACAAEWHTATWCFECGHVVLSRKAHGLHDVATKTLRAGSENCWRTVAAGSPKEAADICRALAAELEDEKG